MEIDTKLKPWYAYAQPCAHFFSNSFLLSSLLFLFFSFLLLLLLTLFFFPSLQQKQLPTKIQGQALRKFPTTLPSSLFQARTSLSST